MKRSADPSPATTASSAAVRSELIAQLHASAAVPLINVFVATICVAVLWPTYPAWVTAAWFLACLANAAGRAFLIGRFRWRQTKGELVGGWARAYTLGAGANGVIWGLLASAVLISPDPAHAIFVAFVMGGMVTGAAVYNSLHMPAFYSFTATAALPVIAALLVRGSPILTAMSLLLTSFVAAVTMFAREHARRAADDSRMKIELRTLNADLAGKSSDLAREIADKTHLVAELEESRARLQAAQRLAQVGSWTFDPQTHQSNWSEESYRILGLDPGDTEPDFARLAKVMAPDAVAAIESAVQVCLERGVAFAIDQQFNPLGGQPGWISMHGQREGVPGKLLLKGTIQDISLRKEAEVALHDEKEVFRSVVEQSQSGIFIVAEDGTLAYLNTHARRILGVSDADAPIGAPVTNFVVESDRAAVEGVMGRQFNGGEPFGELAVTISRADGSSLDILGQGALATFRGKRVIMVAMMDISERKRAERAIAELNTQTSAAMEVLRRHGEEQATMARLSDMLQSCQTISEAYPIISAAAKTLFPGSRGGLARAETASRGFTRVADWGEALLAPSFLVEDCWALRGGQCHEGEGPTGPAECHHFTHAPDGPYICMPLMVMGVTRGLLTLAVAKDQAIDDDLRQLMQSFGDILKLSLANLNLRDSLSEQAIRDPLTGLFNRRYLDETLPRELGRVQRTGAPLTVAMLDIDFFKALNDEHGHDAGDAVLREIGVRLKADLRADDIACRYGGEEFLLVLPDCSVEDALGRLRQICADVKGAKIDFRGIALPPVTFSVGVATRGVAVSTGEALVTAADQAMYLAKRRGRDRIETFSKPTPAQASGAAAQKLAIAAPKRRDQGLPTETAIN